MNDRILDENATRMIWMNRYWWIVSPFTWLCVYLEYTLLSYGGEVW